MSPIYRCPQCERKNMVPREAAGPNRCRFCGAALRRGKDAEPSNPRQPGEDASEGLALEEPPAPSEPAWPPEEEEAFEGPEPEQAVTPQVGAGGVLLCFWVGLAGSLAFAWSAAAVGAAALAGTPWTGATEQVGVLVAAFAVLVVGLLTGTKGPAGAMSSGVLAVVAALLALAALVDGGAVVAVELARTGGSSLPADALTRAFVGLTGLLVLREFARGKGWARRCFGLVLLALLATAAALWGDRLEMLLRGETHPFVFLRTQAVPLGIAGAGALLLAVSLVCMARSVIFSPWHALGMLAGLALTAGAVGYCGYSLSRSMGWTFVAAKGASLGWGLAAAAVVPVVAAGVWWCWRSRLGLGQDALDCARFGWYLAVPAVAVLLVLWLPPALEQGQFHAWLVGLAGVSVLLGAWIGLRRDPWIARWALVPAALGTVALVCSPDAFMVRMVPGIGGLGLVLGRWPRLVLWFLLVIPAIFATVGLATATRLARGPSAARADANIIHTAGWISSAALLLMFYVVRAGRPALGEGVRRALGSVGGAAGDVVHVMAGHRAADALSTAFGRGVAFFFAEGWTSLAAVGGVLVFLVGIHVFSRHGCRWCGYVTSLIWGLIMLGGAALTAVAGFRLFSPPAAEQLETWTGKALATSLMARMAVVALLLGLLWRLSDSLRAIYRQASGKAGAELEKSHREGSNAGTAHFSSLANLGMLACAAGMILALMLGLSISTEAVFFEIKRVAFTLRESFAFAGCVAGVFATTSAGASFCVGTLAVLLIALHEETRRGRLSAYPWVAALWLVLLTRLGVAGYHQFRSIAWPAPPGQRLALVALGFLWLVLALSVIGLLRRWVRLNRKAPEEPPALETEVEGHVSGPARSLGSLGVVLGITLAVVMIYGALWSYPAFFEPLEQIETGVEKATVQAGAAIDRGQMELKDSRLLTVTAAAVGGISAVLLILHFAAQHGSRWAGIITTAVWSGVLVGSIGLFGRLVDFRSLGQWELGQLLTALLAAIAILAVLSATAGSWLGLLAPGRRR